MLSKIRDDSNQLMMRTAQVLVLVLGWTNQESLEGHQRGLDPIEDAGLPKGGGGLEKGGELPKLGCADGQFSCADYSKCLPGNW